jgi:GTP pyrophosphokinase
MSVPNEPDSTLPFDAAWMQAASAGLDDDGIAFLASAVAWVRPHYKGSRFTSGEPFALHAAGTLRILADLHTDAATRVAALLAAISSSDTSTSPSQDQAISETFGSEVSKLVDGCRALIRLNVVARQAQDNSANTGSQKEMLRKMLLAMAADLRIVLMRLASRLRTLRWHAESKTVCSPRFARETLDLYTPLANRLGIWQVKWEMEDLSFRYLDADEYKRIARLLEEKRAEREAFISGAIARLREALTRIGVTADVSGRPKHIYSIWNKMRVKHLEFNQMYDLRALRIIVQDVRDCYTALALVHEMWTPVGDEFDDYISRPKPNGYRSLHTVVADTDGRPFEVQIRTVEMHRFAEYGMAAHWRYKEAGARGGQVAARGEYDRQMAWMRQLLAWNLDIDAPNAAFPSANPGNDANAGSAESRPDEEGPVAPGADVSHATAKSRALTASHREGDPIYVLTPQARVIELPEGATPVDFAYHLHTDLGHRCRGAKIDGQLVSLNTHLSTGQTVEIVSTKSGGPSRDWLNPQLGFLASPRARAKVRMWFNAIELQQRITQGQALIEKELSRLGKTAINLEHLATQLGFSKADDLYVAAAKDEFSLRQIDTLLQAQSAPPRGLEHSDVTHASRAESAQRSGKSGVLVVGVGSLLTQLARCCRPAPPDPIAGFVTRGRGVSIHRVSCPSYRALACREPERLIDVTWGQTAETLYPVDISVHALDRQGLLRDLSEIFTRLHLNVIGVNTQSRQSLAHMIFTVEVRDADAMNRALATLAELPGVSSAVRK